jgi:hypothetical protein
MPPLMAPTQPAWKEPKAYSASDPTGAASVPETKE